MSSGDDFSVATKITKQTRYAVKFRIISQKTLFRCDSKEFLTMTNSNWWQPENLKKLEIDFRNDPNLTDTNNDFGTYKLLNNGHSVEASNLISHNTFKEQTLNSIMQTYNTIIKRRGISKISSIADLGCGAGFTSAALKKTFPKADVVGYDISEDAISFAKRNHRECSFISRSLTSADNIVNNVASCITLIRDSLS